MTVETQAAVGLSLDEFLDRGYERSELFGGEVRPKPVPTWNHSSMQGQVLVVLRAMFGRRAVPEASLRIGEESPVPDVIVAGSADPVRYRGIVADPPLLCVEVISPSQTPEEMFAKCQRYRHFGVPYCWVIDPDAKRAWEMIPGGGFAEVTDSFLTPQPVPLAALFE